jgi:hypothetical protein
MKSLPHQILPLALIFALTIVALVTARVLLIPDTFGDLGHYRADAVDEIAALEITYAGSTVCGDCHDDILEDKEASHHEGVSCETCHGPAYAHTEEPDVHLPKVPRQRGHCQLCHGYNQSRPSGFPQILPNQHNPGKACISCHDPHKPLLPHAPDDCAACHREIMLKKRVSHHASLDCTTCHVVPDQHPITPRSVRAEKPRSNELCGGCHSQGAAQARAIPQIDLESHGEHYNCWDCHYPHYPEANR